MRLSKWFSIGFAVLALSSGSALASDASADRAAALQGTTTVVSSSAVTHAGHAAAAVQGGASDCARMDCCAMMRSMRPSEAKPANVTFTDVG